MKFKNYIEAESGIKDTGGSPGAVNQLLSSTVTGTAWIDPATIVAEAATLVVIACKNTSGAAIAQGTPVYQTGTVGATATIEIAPADALISANKTSSYWFTANSTKQQRVWFCCYIRSFNKFYNISY